MEAVTIRPATSGDCDRIAAIIDDPPSRQSVAIAGDEDRARAAGRLFVRSGISIQLASTVLAEVDAAVVGIMDAGVNRTDPAPGPMLYVRLLVPALRAVGPDGLWRFFRSRAAWDRVSFEPAPSDYFIAELGVAASHRNRGIGGALLQFGEEQARRAGCTRMSLTTNVDNPARRLYERTGFRVVDTKTDRQYEHWGGSRGRVFMVKDLVSDI